MNSTTDFDTRRWHSATTCFYKLILSSSSLFQKLRIPKTFAEEVLRDKIPNIAILQVPTGESRKVAIVEEDDELWFHDGWKEFVDRFSIGFACFVLFEYEGGLKFRVSIFDLTACEISYPCYVRNTSPVHYDQHCCNDHSGDKYQRKNKPEFLHKPSLSSKISEVEVIKVDSDDDEEMIDVKKCTPIAYPFWLKKYEGLMKVVIGAGISLPDRNPFFVVAIKPYVLNKFLNIPRPFGRQHLGHQKVTKLEAYDGRQWEVKCVKVSSKYCFQGGWKIFARAIGLQTGDVCVYELIDVEKNVIKVHVVKKSEIKVSKQLKRMSFDHEE